MGFEDLSNAYRQGTLVIDCVTMKLTQRGTDTPIIYEGKGLITQIDNDHLNYKLFATHAKNIDPGAEMMRMFNGTSGKVIEADQYYDLTANDVHGQVWTSEHIQPNSIWPQDDLPVLHGGLRYISAATTSRIPHNSVSIECFKALDFPTRFGRQIARAPVEDTFKVGSIEFSTRQSDEGFQISAVSDQPLDENYYLRIIEALKFVTARPVLPRIITHVTGDKATVYFSAASPTNPRMQQFQPLSPNSWAYARDSKALFGCYLRFITTGHTGEYWHHLTFFLDNAAQATGGSVHSWAAGLGVAVEGLLSLIDVPANETNAKDLKDFGDWLIGQIRASEAHSSFETRMAGMVSSMGRLGPKDRMQVLIDKGVIDAPLRKAWNELRNANVHPDASALNQNPNTDLQPLYDRICKTSVLMYQIVFHLIGYEGQYTNYGVHGFPEAQYAHPPLASPSCQDQEG